MRTRGRDDRMDTHMNSKNAPRFAWVKTRKNTSIEKRKWIKHLTHL